MYGSPNSAATATAISTNGAINAGGTAVNSTALTPTITPSVATTTTVQFVIQTFTAANGGGTATSTNVGCTISAGATTCVSANNVTVPAAGSFNIKIVSGGQTGNTVTAAWVVNYY